MPSTSQQDEPAKKEVDILDAVATFYLEKVAPTIIILVMLTLLVLMAFGNLTGWSSEELRTISINLLIVIPACMGFGFFVFIVIIIFSLIYNLIKQFNLGSLFVCVFALSMFSVLILIMFDSYEGKIGKFRPLFPMNLTGGHTRQIIDILVKVVVSSLVCIVLSAFIWGRSKK